MLLLKGRPLSKKVLQRASEEISASDAEPPGLAVVLVGNNPASETYVAYKQKACTKTGLKSTLIRLSDKISENDLLHEINSLNENRSIHGILCQLPLPDHISSSKVASAIDPEKDVDGFHPVNVGKLWRGEDGLFPCTPSGIIALLKESEIRIDGADTVIVGRSNIVGKPMAALFLREHATVTLTHSHTTDLKSVTRRADILVVAMGRPGFITGEFVKQGATVIDVGISRTEDKGLAGDVDFDSVSRIAGAVTPVPGGVGPLTIAFLINNTLRSWRRTLKYIK